MGRQRNRNWKEAEDPGGSVSEISGEMVHLPVSLPDAFLREMTFMAQESEQVKHIRKRAQNKSMQRALIYAADVCAGELQEEDVARALRTLVMPCEPGESHRLRAIGSVEAYLRTTNLVWNVLTEVCTVQTSWGWSCESVASQHIIGRRIAQARTQLIARLPVNMQTCAQALQEALQEDVISAVADLAREAEEALDDMGWYTSVCLHTRYPTFWVDFPRELAIASEERPRNALEVRVLERFFSREGAA